MDEGFFENFHHKTPEGPFRASSDLHENNDHRSGLHYQKPQKENHKPRKPGVRKDELSAKLGKRCMRVAVSNSRPQDDWSDHHSICCLTAHLNAVKQVNRHGNSF